MSELVLFKPNAVLIMFPTDRPVNQWGTLGENAFFQVNRKNHQYGLADRP